MTIASNLSFLQNSVGAITTGTINAIGSPITFSVNSTEYNRIDTNGYSLIGYTTSQGAYKLQVNGNVLINGTLSLTTASIGNITGSVTTASNIAGGTAGQLHYQTGVGLTGFAGPGTAGQLLVSAGASAPVYTNTASIYVGRAVVADTATVATTATSAGTAYATIASLTAGTGLTGTAFNGSTAQTWTLNTATLMATTVNLASGTAGQLPYQSAANTTLFLGPGTFGQFLMSTGASAPVYQSTLTQAGGNIVVTSNSASTSTTTGALQVINGGVGIGGSVYVGNRVGFVNASNVSAVYQVYNSAANSLDTIFG